MGHKFTWGDDSELIKRSNKQFDKKKESIWEHGFLSQGTEFESSLYHLQYVMYYSINFIIIDQLNKASQHLYAVDVANIPIL